MRSHLYALGLFCLFLLPLSSAYAQPHQLDSKTDHVGSEHLVSQDLTLVAPEVVDACQEPVMQMVAEFRNRTVDRAQFDFTLDGKDFTGIGIDSNPEDGFSVKWNVQTLPPGNYKISVVGFSKDKQVEEQSSSLRLTNTVPAPSFVSPQPNQMVSQNQIRLKVDQEISTVGWKSVFFEYSIDRQTYFPIGTDTNGNDGFGMMFDLSNLPATSISIRATVTDIFNKTVDAFVSIDRVQAADFFSDLPLAPVIFNSFTAATGPSQPILGNSLSVGQLNGTLSTNIDPTLLSPAPIGGIRAFLFLDGLNNEDTFNSNVELAPGESTANFAVNGLEKGEYRGVVLLQYNSFLGMVDLRSDELKIDAQGSTNTPLVEEKAAFDFLDQMFTNGTRNGNITAKSFEQDLTASLMIESNDSGTAMVDIQDLLRLGNQTFFNLAVTNTGNGTLVDVLEMTGYYWSDDGLPLAFSKQSFPVNLAPGETTLVGVVESGTWGRVSELGGIQAALVDNGANVEAFASAGVGAEVKAINEVPLEVGQSMVEFDVSQLKSAQKETQGKYVEFHKVRCDKSNYKIFSNPDPKGTYSTTIRNSNGTSGSFTGITRKLHARIIGGPHRVRTVCIKSNGETVLYGADYYVHEAIRSVEVQIDGRDGKRKNKSGETTEYRCEKIPGVGLSGPGGTVSHTDGISSTHSSSITTTLGSSIGAEGIASISSSTGITAGQSVTKSSSDTYSKKIGDNKCGFLMQRACFRVVTGTVTTTYTDGTVVRSRFRAETLTGIGYKLIEKPCP